MALGVGGRTGKQCRERFVHHLAPGLHTAAWTDADDAVIFAQIQLHGTRWVEVAKALPGRAPQAVKNRYYATCRKVARAKTRAGEQVLGMVGLPVAAGGAGAAPPAPR